MLVKQVLNCSFSQWFHKFSHISIESEVIRLSTQFIDYLLSDGIVLPKSSENNYSYETDEEWSDGINDNKDDNLSDEENNSLEFGELEAQMSPILVRFGSVFPKLNWSSCQDSKWIIASGTRCTQISDIYLLLKSSDNVVHDLTEPFKFCEDLSEESIPCVEYELILRKWVDINPSMEFRCFIANNTLIGISQRDVRSYYEHISQQKDDIVLDIKTFFTQNMKEKFFDSDFVIDVYRPQRQRILLIDINPFGQLTDSLLFDWEELNDIRENCIIDEVEDENIEFRHITSETGIQCHSYALNSLPIEVNYGYDLQRLINNQQIDR